MGGTVGEAVGVDEGTGGAVVGADGADAGGGGTDACPGGGDMLLCAGATAWGGVSEVADGNVVDGATGACIVLVQASAFLTAFLFAPKRGLLAVRATRPPRVDAASVRGGVLDIQSEGAVVRPTRIRH